MKIWAHRGCSQSFPENTMTAFSKAVEIPGLTGIELDIQMTKDGEIVVIHDERVDRTTDGIGYVKDFTYRQLRQLIIDAGEEKKEKIPSIQEVLDFLRDKMAQGMLLNIELKNSIIPYEGMEDKILDLIGQRCLLKEVIFSSFYVRSLERIRKRESAVSVGVLDTNVSDCFYKKNGAFDGEDVSVALHPFWKRMDMSRNELKGQTVRAWFSGHLYPELPTGKKLDLGQLECYGITDVFLNEPEVYLS
ncbi:MAG: hypothetical protein HDR03_11240 [Lachnospiraceae bacterium]|nr:hypothetical protein [Lachnospiraceae bacterium]